MSRFVYRADAERILVRQPLALAALSAATKRVENQAKQLIRPYSGRFADEIDSTIGVDEKGPVGRVNAHWWGSLFVEFGTSTQVARAPLRRALAQRTG